MRFDASVGVHQQDVDGAFRFIGTGDSFVVARPDGKVHHTVTVNVSNGCNRCPELVELFQFRRNKARQTITDFDMRFDCSVVVQDQNIEGAFTILGVFLTFALGWLAG